MTTKITIIDSSTSCDQELIYTL